MTAWDRYWFGPVAAVRPYVLERAVLFLLALDSWVQFVPHGGRYGAGGFNVAHFLWLDAIQPLPSPALHVGLVLIVGGLAWVIACTGGNHSLRVLLLVLYTYCWAMSRLDAYQHHYLLSLLLGAFVFFPALEAADVLDAGARRISAWAYVVVAANLAIVYTFAAVTKTEAAWASGAVLQQVTGGSRWFQSVWSWVLHESGVRGDVLWEVLARAVAVMQILIASAYVVAVRADASRARWVRLLAWAALVAAVGFHGSLLSFPIEIRWFSYYMITVAGAFFLPERALDAIVRLATFPLRMVAASAARWSATRFQAVAVAASASCIVALVGSQLDLPGGTAAPSRSPVSSGFSSPRSETTRRGCVKWRSRQPQVPWCWPRPSTCRRSGSSIISTSSPTCSGEESRGKFWRPTRRPSRMRLAGKAASGRSRR